MDEQSYKTVNSTGITSLVLGICITISGITAGVLLIINGARLLHMKKKILF